MEPCEQAVEGDEAGLVGEDAVELGGQRGFALRCRLSGIGLEVAVERPDQVADEALSTAIVVREGVELMDQTLGMRLIQSSG